MFNNLGKYFTTFFSVILLICLALAGTADAQLVWKGHTWDETTGGMAGVANGNPANITVDANGYLHLTITKRGSTYTASEMFTEDKLGFGTYQYWIQGPVDNMDKSTVLGLFPYGPVAGIGADGEDELDIELSKWNNTLCGGSCNGDFTFYPATGKKSVGPTEDDYTFSLNGGNLLTARLVWTPTSVTGTIMSGLQPIGTTQNVLHTWTFAPANNTVKIPQVALPLGINLWAFTVVPVTNQEVIIQDFQFVPQGAADFGLTATPASQTVTAGSGTSYTATLNAINGFTGVIALTATGLPTGATASFSPSSVSGSGTSTVSVTTSASTPAGSYPVTIKGTSGSLTHSVNVTLVVNTTPNFTISASPASQTVSAGSGTSYTATVAAVNGFTGNVALSASGLPTGATASFSPTSLNGSGTSTMSVATTASTPAGAYTLTITGTSGTLTHAATVTLIVNGPANFTIAASPSSQTIAVGSGTSYTATVSATNGFTGSVALTASGLPTGATATFTPTSVTGSGTSTLAVTTSGSTPAGTYTLTITGTSGSLTHSASVTLVVTTAGGTLTNIAPSGTGYIWRSLTTQTATTHQTATPGINDNNLTVGINAFPTGETAQNRYEAGGVIFSAAQSGISQVKFLNGQIDSNGNGNFEQSLALQTYNGTAWTNVTGWTVAPAYPYTTAAGGITYSFTGPNLNSVLGVRVVGLVRCSCLDNSWSWIVNEVQIYALR